MSRYVISESVNGFTLTLNTSDNLFSPRAIDRGTRALLSACEFKPGMRVLDLGCGAGVAGIVAAKICGAENVLMSDVSEEAVCFARQNARLNGADARAVVSDGFNQIDETGFDIILSNPPYQSDFAVAKHFIEKGFNRLKIGGKLMLVTKRRAWYENKLRSVFGGCHIIMSDGYYVFAAEKRRARYAK